MLNAYKKIDKLEKVSTQFLLNCRVMELLGETVVYDIENNPHGFHSTFNEMNPNSIMIVQCNQSFPINPHMDDSFFCHQMHSFDRISTGREHSIKQYFVEISEGVFWGDTLNIAFVKALISKLESEKPDFSYSDSLLELMEINNHDKNKKIT